MSVYFAILPHANLIANRSHVCGINSRQITRKASGHESFPRMWDQPTKPQINAVPKRINPTFVGSTRLIGATTSLATNHSHVCGINHTVTFNVNFKYESFPRMWDQLLCCRVGRACCRIIPTYVGSTSCCLSARDVRCESFPRMWDQLLAFNHIVHNLRIIPTYVGSTRARNCTSAHNTNHSHVCGINSGFGFSPGSGAESFPRMWDQRPYQNRKLSYIRIIPTYVGSTRLNCRGP